MRWLLIALLVACKSPPETACSVVATNAKALVLNEAARDAFHASVLSRCNTDHWPEALRQCIAQATSAEALTACTSQMTSVQAMAFTQQMQVSFRPKPPPAPTETLVVHLHANGTKDVDGMPVNDMELDIVFRGALKTDPQPHMVFAPDKGVSQDVAVKLLDRAKAAGLTNVSIATSP